MVIELLVWHEEAPEGGYDGAFIYETTYGAVLGDQVVETLEELGKTLAARSPPTCGAEFFLYLSASWS